MKSNLKFVFCNVRCIFRILLNIYDGSLLRKEATISAKKVPSLVLNSVRNTPLNTVFTTMDLSRICVRHEKLIATGFE